LPARLLPVAAQRNVVKRLVLLISIAAFLFTPVYGVTVMSEAVERESTICGALKERFVFWMWSRMAPSPDASRIAQIKNIQAVSFVTSDNKTLRGYKYSAHDGSGETVTPKGYILMALGNAMIADQMIGDLADYARGGHDAYIYDYRGYGNSEGKRRINAIIEDYREIISHLNSKYDRKMLYGVSLGGAVMLNAIGSGVEFDAAVIDSSPSKLSDKGCPARIDPVSHVTVATAPRLLVITGKGDQVLPPVETGELREKAAAMGARTIDGDGFAHPYMDRSYDVHLRRTNLVRDYLLRQQ
jgi:predicted esterase